ncbi:hypothetical protein [Paraburkholderia sp. BCC1886]|uniref:hypothetical protein n=1 Tax=Paraburkholderia sp. BCC1886 TaxID=2562670 RepID=UPI0011833753|nr:hypothetical protein [Paraburkholderia sp. BCC1886]
MNCPHKTVLSHVLVLTTTALLAVAGRSASAQDAPVDPQAGQKALEKAAMVHHQVRIVAIDAANHRLTLRSARGDLADVEVDPALADIRKLRVGDRLNVAYQQALLLHVDKLATRGVRERIETTTTLPAANGYASSAHRVQVVATVLRIDRRNRLVTLRGPKHQQVLRASREIALDRLKVGDSVRAEFISAAAVELVRE